MSTDPPPRSLSDYVAEVIRRLRATDPNALARLRRVVGGRRAQIALDFEAIDVGWNSRGLHITPAGDGPVAGTGKTDRQTVLELLAGQLELHDAILDGRLHLTGEIYDIERMVLAVEILIDAAARSPALQGLAEDFCADPDRPPRQPTAKRDPSSRSEHRLLGRLDLLP
jgi:hypothetical protein